MHSWDMPMWSSYKDEFDDKDRKYMTYIEVEKSVKLLAEQLVQFNN